MKSKLQAELIGLHIGDGSLYQTSWGPVWEIRGDLKEKEFYDKHICPLVSALADKKIRAKKRSGGKNGCYGIQTTNKELLTTFSKFKISVGSKGDTIEIPKKLLQTNKLTKKYLLRGLFATDGTIYLAKINKNKEKTYPMIEYATISKVLCEQVKTILLEFGLESYSWTYYSKKGNKPCYFLRLSGKRKARSFIDNIGFINPKHQKIANNIRNL